MPSHELLEHTGETRLLVRGGPLAEVFGEAARALGELERESLEPTCGMITPAVAEQAGLARRVARLRPVGLIKG